MKIVKTLKYTFLSVLGFIVLLLLLTQIFKNTIIEKVVASMASSLEVPVTVGDIDLSLFKAFPEISIEFDDVRLSENGDTTGVNNILQVGKLYASVEAMRFINDGDVIVKKIEMQDASVNYYVDTAGISNLDFLIDLFATDDTTEIEPVEQDTVDVGIQNIYSLESFELNNVRVVYTDDNLNIAGATVLNDVEIKGGIGKVMAGAKIEGNATVDSIKYGNFNLKELYDSKLDFDIVAVNDTFKLNKFIAQTHMLNIDLDGKFYNFDTPEYAVGVSIDVNKLKNIIDIFPKEDLDAFKIHKLDGLVQLKGNAEGVLSDSIMPKFVADITVENLEAQYDTLPSIDNITMHANFTTGEEPSIENCHLQINDFLIRTMNNELTATADIKNFKNINYQLTSKGKVKLSDWISYIPDDMQINTLRGAINYNLATYGVFKDSITDAFIDKAIRNTALSASASGFSFEMDSIPSIKNLSANIRFAKNKFKLSNFNVSVPEYGASLNNTYADLAYSGSISDIDNMSFEVDSLHMLINKKSSVTAKGKLLSLNSGQYSIKAQTYLDLESLQTLVPDSLEMKLSGTAGAEFKSEGKFNIDSIADQAIDLFFANSNMNAVTNNLTVIMPDSLTSISDLSTTVSYDNDLLTVDKTTGIYNLIDFNVDSVSVSNIYSGFFLNRDSVIKVLGNFYAGDVDYKVFAPFMIEDSTATVASNEDTGTTDLSTSDIEEPANWSYKFLGNIGVRSFRYENALLEDLSLRASVTPSLIVTNNFKMKAFNGEMGAKLKISMKDSVNSTLWAKVHIDKMDVSKLLEDFNNFEDFYTPMVTSEQVSGIFTSDFDVQVMMENFEPNMNKTYMSGDLTLQEGALVGIEELEAVEKIPFIGLDGLDNLRFGEIKSEVFMSNNKIYIPRTELRSTAMDAMILGMFDNETHEIKGEELNDYAFHMRIFLGEILTGKNASKLQQQMKEDGFDANNVEEDELTKGRSSVYVVVKQDGDKFTAWLDKQKERKLMIAKINSLRKIQEELRFNPKLISYDLEEE